MKIKNSEHLQWIHDRMVNVYSENPNADFLVKLREIIAKEKIHERETDELIEILKHSANENRDDS